MKPVMQTRDGFPKGNCLMAATASILEVPLESLPDLYEEGERRGGDALHWWGVYIETLLLHGLTVALVPNGEEGYPVVRPKGYAIASILYGELHHATVALDGDIVHDPHPLQPSKLPGAKIIRWYILVPLARAA